MGNYCRNPNNATNGIWCFVDVDGVPTKELCDVKNLQEHSTTCRAFGDSIKITTQSNTSVLKGSDVKIKGTPGQSEQYDNTVDTPLHIEALSYKDSNWKTSYIKINGVRLSLHTNEPEVCSTSNCRDYRGRMNYT